MTTQLQPEETIDLGNGNWAGIAYDDGCLVALMPNVDDPFAPMMEDEPAPRWKSVKWIPPRVAIRMGELAATHYK